MTMLYFPQLSSGAMGQLPLRWSDAFRTVVNGLADGGTIALRDPAGAGIQWSLSLSGLNDTERRTLQAFFESTHGALCSFTMLDPADNLLAFSEDLGQPCWNVGPLLRLTSGTADPLGGTGGFTITNTGQAQQAVSQQISAPGGFHYSLSAYFRANAPGAISLAQTCGVSTLRTWMNTTASWQRFTMSGAAGSGDGVSFAIEVPSGGQVQVFGLQAEAQPAAGSYKKTMTSGGVYENCRFDQDELQMTATGPDAFECSLQIRSAGRVPWQA
jgi:hypothetical protein